MKMAFHYTFGPLRKLFYGILVFVVAFVITSRSSAHRSQETALEMVVFPKLTEIDSTYLQPEPWNPDTLFVRIPSESRAKQQAIGTLDRYLDSVSNRSMKNAILVVSFSRSCMYSDFISVLDSFVMHRLDFGRFGSDYYARLAVRDTSDYKYPL